MKAKNIIMGAGLSGLSCGYMLKDRCIILEKEPHVGGLAVTKHFYGFKFDLGGHRFFTRNNNTKKFIMRLLGDEIIQGKRRSKIYRNRKFIDYPLQVSIIFQLNPFEIALCLFTYLLRKIKPLRESSFKERAINSFGDRLYELFFRDYTKKVWGIDCGYISKELVDIRLQDISLTRVIKHAFKKYENIRSFTNDLLYPKDGIGRIAESLSKGLDIRLNSKITGLISRNGRIENIIVDNAQEHECENLVSTIPVTRLVEFLNPPASVKNAAMNLKYRSLICVFIVLNDKSYTPNHWIYFPCNEIFGRLHEPKNWSAYMSPEEKTGICVEIFCTKDDKVWNMNDTEIAHQVIRTLPLLKEFEAEDHCLVRIEYAYPVYDIHYKENIEKIYSYLSSYKNLFLLGRTGSFKYINMDTCIEEGLALGSALSIINRQAQGILC